jgi:trigger factor
MQVTREDLNPCTVKLDVVCEEPEVKAGFDKAYRQIAKRVRIPGFRPGHAPRSVVEKVVAKEEVLEMAAENIVRAAYKDALKEQNLEPYQQPTVELTKIDEDSSELAFSVKVPLAPQIELGEYKGLHVQLPPAQVTDEDVEYHLTELRKGRATREQVTDRGAEEGDYAVVNIKINGEEGDGRNFMSVVGQTFPQLDQAISGMKVEEIKVLDLTFPENFHEQDWSGKTLHCTLTVRSLTAVNLPTVDDAFAQSLNLDNVQDLEVRLRERIGVAKKEILRQMSEDQMYEELASRSTVHVPDTMWEPIAAQRLREIQDEEQKKNRTLEQYAQERGMTLEELVERWKHEAKQNVIRAVLMREIFDREKMELTNQELNDELIMMAREYEVAPDVLLGELRKNNMMRELEFRAIARKVSDFLLENAEQQEVSA